MSFASVACTSVMVTMMPKGIVSWYVDEASTSNLFYFAVTVLAPKGIVFWYVDKASNLLYYAVKVALEGIVASLIDKASNLLCCAVELALEAISTLYCAVKVAGRYQHLVNSQKADLPVDDKGKHW